MRWNPKTHHQVSNFTNCKANMCRISNSAPARVRNYVCIQESPWQTDSCACSQEIYWPCGSVRYSAVFTIAPRRATVHPVALYIIHFNIILPFRLHLVTGLIVSGFRVCHFVSMFHLFMRATYHAHVIPLWGFRTTFEDSGSGMWRRVAGFMVIDVSKERSSFVVKSRTVDPWRWSHYVFSETSGTTNAARQRRIPDLTA
jgi:hypothetical protein